MTTMDRPNIGVPPEPPEPPQRSRRPSFFYMGLSQPDDPWKKPTQPLAQNSQSSQSAQTSQSSQPLTQPQDVPQAPNASKGQGQGHDKHDKHAAPRFIPPPSSASASSGAPPRELGRRASTGATSANIGNTGEKPAIFTSFRRLSVDVANPYASYAKRREAGSAANASQDEKEKDKDKEKDEEDEQRRADVTEFQRVFQQLKLEHPTISVGALQQKTFQRISEMKLEKERLEAEEAKRREAERQMEREMQRKHEEELERRRRSGRSERRQSLVKWVNKIRPREGSFDDKDKDGGGGSERSGGEEAKAGGVPEGAERRPSNQRSQLFHRPTKEPSARHLFQMPASEVTGGESDSDDDKETHNKILAFTHLTQTLGGALSRTSMAVRRNSNEVVPPNHGEDHVPTNVHNVRRESRRSSIDTTSRRASLDTNGTLDKEESFGQFHVASIDNVPIGMPLKDQAAILANQASLDPSLNFAPRKSVGDFAIPSGKEWRKEMMGDALSSQSSVSGVSVASSFVSRASFVSHVSLASHHSLSSGLFIDMDGQESCGSDVNGGGGVSGENGVSGGGSNEAEVDNEAGAEPNARKDDNKQQMKNALDFLYPNPKPDGAVIEGTAKTAETTAEAIAETTAMKFIDPTKRRNDEETIEKEGGKVKTENSDDSKDTNDCAKSEINNANAGKTNEMTLIQCAINDTTWRTQPLSPILNGIDDNWSVHTSNTHNTASTSFTQDSSGLIVGFGRQLKKHQHHQHHPHHPHPSQSMDDLSQFTNGPNYDFGEEEDGGFAGDFSAWDNR